jgi:flagellar basal-body rod protein FlgF
LAGRVHIVQFNPNMDAITISAASGLQAKMDSLEMLANNIANASTGGFKADREFYSLYISPHSSDPPLSSLPVVEQAWTDFSQGRVRPTGNPSDLALSGPGFFAVNGPNGPLYTRNGAFQVSSAGNLITADGYPVQSTANGQPVQIDPSQPFDISADGSVVQGGANRGRIQLVDFAPSAAHQKIGNSYFQVDAKAVQPAASAEVGQGKIEDSNVGPAEGAVHLVSVMRQFEMLQKAVMIGADMNRKAVEEVAKVG